jgi:2-phosphoglycolate phosphatase
MNLRLILFDLDGTLLDTAPDFVECVNRLRNRHGRLPLPPAAIRAEVSNGARALTRLAFDLDDDNPTLEPLRQELLTLYTDSLGTHSTLFPGMTSSLQWIHDRGLQWGIVTNKPSQYTLPLLEKITFPAPPATVICPDHVKHTKPHPEPLWLACQQAACSAEQAVYLGDHVRDIEAGRAAGMPTVSCGWGYLSPGENCSDWNASHHLQQANEIPGLLFKLLN